MADKPVKKTSGRTYRVPATIKAALQQSIASGKIQNPTHAYYAAQLSSGEPASAEAVSWLKSQLDALSDSGESLGGEAAANWTSKFEGTKTLTAAGFAPDESHEYYAVGHDEENPQNASALLIVDADETLYTWADGGLFPLPATLDDYEAPSIIEISDEDAEALANWMDDPNHEGEFFVLTDIDPEERNLVELAFSEIDWEEIDRMEALTADATGYSPAERSENASRQERSGDGRFGGEQMPRGKTLGAALAKARLALPMPLVLDPAARIDEYIAEIGGASASKPVVASAGEEVEVTPEPAAETETETETLSGDQPLYFAVVDPVDNTAVLDVVSITPDDEGQASAWKRSGGEWVSAPEMLEDFRGDTPPPVVELSDENLAKDVLAQVDSYDADTEALPTEETIVASASTLSDSAKERREYDAKTGIALPDGSYPIHNDSDLALAITAAGRAQDAERPRIQHHLKKRAKSLNRYDMIPSEWREASIFDDDHLSPIYGEFGEVLALVAAAPGVGNAERLRQYWLNGKGDAKIRWGTDGDLTRCHRQLSKYMPGRAWGYCQNLHQRKFGVSNATRDKAVGD